MKYIITVGIAIICAVLGTAVAMSFVGETLPKDAVFFGFLCGGIYVGRLVATTLVYKPKPRRARAKMDTQPNRPYSERLGVFAHGSKSSESVEGSPDASQMPFWMLDVVHEPTPPKTSSFIRRILHRIRCLITPHGG